MPIPASPICYRYFPQEFSFSLKLLLYQKCDGGCYLRKQIILAYYIYYINLYYYTWHFADKLSGQVGTWHIVIPIDPVKVHYNRFVGNAGYPPLFLQKLFCAKIGSLANTAPITDAPLRHIKSFRVPGQKHHIGGEVLPTAFCDLLLQQMSSHSVSHIFPSLSWINIFHISILFPRVDESGRVFICHLSFDLRF